MKEGGKMLCPVCKSECGTENVCKECGFDQLQVEFLSRDDAVHWMDTVVVPYREKYISDMSTTTVNLSNSEKDTLREKTTLDFQEELKQNMRSPEVVRRENAERMNNAMKYDAERTMREIKNALMYKAKNAEYVIENGVTSLTCFCQMPYRFMRSREEDNLEQLKQNQQIFVLFRDPNLIYMTWKNYEINPKYNNEYWQYISALKELAKKEKISIESVVYNSRDKKYVPFPSRVRNDYSGGWWVCVKAKIVVSSNTTTNEKYTF